MEKKWIQRSFIDSPEMNAINMCKNLHSFHACSPLMKIKVTVFFPQQILWLRIYEARITLDGDAWIIWVGKHSWRQNTQIKSAKLNFDHSNQRRFIHLYFFPEENWMNDVQWSISCQFIDVNFLCDRTKNVRDVVAFYCLATPMSQAKQ